MLLVFLTTYSGLNDLNANLTSSLPRGLFPYFDDFLTVIPSIEKNLVFESYCCIYNETMNQQTRIACVLVYSDCHIKIALTK